EMLSGRTISLLTELRSLIDSNYYKHLAPDGAKASLTLRNAWVSTPSLIVFALPRFPAVSRTHKPTWCGATTAPADLPARSPRRQSLPALSACPLQCPAAWKSCDARLSLRLPDAARW